MAVVPFMQPANKSAVPMLVLVDCQLEYTAEGRAFYLETATKALANCSVLLNAARVARLPIAHFRLCQTGHFFNEATAFSHWIDGLKPRASEYAYKRNKFSCFSSSEFCQLIDSIEEPQIIVAGLTGERACLSSLIDSANRDVGVTFIRDCSASAAFGPYRANEAHDAVTHMMSLYGRIETLAGICREINTLKEFRRIS